MKKLGLVFLAIAFVAGGAFAADVAGEVWGSAYVLQGDGEKNSDVTTLGNMIRMRLTFTGQNEDKTLGAQARLNARNGGWSNGGIQAAAGPVGLDGSAYAWWRPNSAIMVGLGLKPGDWFGGRDGVLGSGAMFGGAHDVMVAEDHNNGSARLGDNMNISDRVATGGWNRWGLGMEITPPPVKGLKINIGIPYMSSNNGATVAGTNLGKEPEKIPDPDNYGQTIDNPNYGKDKWDSDTTIGVGLPQGATTNMGGGFVAKAATTYSNIFYQAVYEMDVLKGWIALTYRPDRLTPSTNPVDRGLVYATVNSKAVDNLELTASVGVRLPGKVYINEKDDNDNWKQETTSHPIAAGIGAVYKNGDLGVNFRTLATFGGKKWSDKPASIERNYNDDFELTSWKHLFKKATDDQPLRIVVDVVPNYAVTDTLRAYLGLGITSIGETKTEGDAKNIPGSFGWVVNPFVTLEVGGRVSLYAGFRVQANGGYYSDGKDRWKEKDGTRVQDNGRDNIVNWAVPIGIKASF